MRHKWFMASCVVLILMGLAHFVASLSQKDPTDPQGIELMKLMKEYQIPEVKRSMEEISVGFSHFFEVASVMMGIAGLAVGRQGSAARRLAMVYAVSLVVMLAISLVYWFFIPTSFLALALVLTVVSLIPKPAPNAIS